MSMDMNAARNELEVPNHTVLWKLYLDAPPQEEYWKSQKY